MSEQQAAESAYHVSEAERLLDLANSPAGIALRLDGYDALAAAQVHATLAVALSASPGSGT